MSASAGWRTVSTSDGEFQVRDMGSGPAIVLIGTVLVADGLIPLAAALERMGGHRVVAYRLRGYGGSGPPSAGTDVADDARDCVDLMDALAIDAATVVGVGYGAAVALEVATAAPARVSHLCLIEPPPMMAECSHEYRTANAETLAEYAAIGAWPAGDNYLRRIIGRHWRAMLERALPGSIDQVRADAPTYFEVTLPRVMQWTFTHEQAALVAAPTLLVTGGSSVRWFTEEACALHQWLQRPTDAVIRGADHSLLLTHPHKVADALLGYLRGGAA